MFRVAIISASLLPAAPAPAPAQEAPPFEVIRALDAEMAGIGYRLATANASLCDRQEPGLGLLLHTPDQYARDIRETAIRHFHFDGPVGVEAVISKSPAAAADIREDDTVIGVGRTRFRPTDPQANSNTASLIVATHQIMALPPNGPITLHIRRSGVAQIRRVIPVPACRSRFEVAFGNSFLAQADGELVQISSRFLTDYPQWAPVPIAHELAHNILRHRERLEAKGVSYGLLSGIGRNVRFFRQTELEADILSISLLTNAGYDPKIALLFWQAFGPAHAGSLFRSRTHPSWKTRTGIMARTIAEMAPERSLHPDIIAARDRPIDGKWQDLLKREH